MSYIVAFVRFTETDHAYPVDCFRTDLRVDDKVLVRRGDGKIRTAIVAELKYLNWNCGARIECKVSEADASNGFVEPPQGSPIVCGMVTLDDLVGALRARKWIPQKSGNNVHRVILGYVNENETAHVLMRRNGIDLQICATDNQFPLTPWSTYSRSISEGRLVRHHLAHTTFNLLEGIFRFAESFASNEGNYDRFFKSVGKRDRRTADLRATRDDLSDIYDAIAGDGGGSAYLGDGVWIGAGGSLSDRGR